MVQEPKQQKQEIIRLIKAHKAASPPVQLSAQARARLLAQMEAALPRAKAPHESGSLGVAGGWLLEFRAGLKTLLQPMPGAIMAGAAFLGIMFGATGGGDILGSNDYAALTPEEEISLYADELFFDEQDLLEEG
jgi:hypothetical protein